LKKGKASTQHCSEARTKSGRETLPATPTGGGAKVRLKRRKTGPAVFGKRASLMFGKKTARAARQEE